MFPAHTSISATPATSVTRSARIARSRSRNGTGRPQPTSAPPSTRPACPATRIAGISTELTYELTELTDDHLVLVGTNESATSTDTITVVPHGGGSEVTYRAVIAMKGAARLAAPLVKLVFEKVGNDTEDDMVRVLDRL